PRFPWRAFPTVPLQSCGQPVFAAAPEAAISRPPLFLQRPIIFLGQRNLFWTSYRGASTIALRPDRECGMPDRKLTDVGVWLPEQATAQPSPLSLPYAEQTAP